MVEITGVGANSRAARAGILPGDILISINSNEISDVLDYRFYLAEKHVRLLCRRGEVDFEAAIIKGEYDDIGLEFETPLMDKKHSCRNKCVFCFIDQLPRGLRGTLYFKDDDSRLSFLHGNYITLTNLYDKDIDRIIKMHISPVNISVHTTNPSLRCEMMKNRRAGEVLSYLGKFAEAGISICAQIVLCKGLNDGGELDRTMRELAGYFPALCSVSVVPAGLTKFREGLYPLEEYTPEECRAVISQVDEFAAECAEKYGFRLFFCADELYVKGELPLPPAEYYEDYPQIENGVGMLRSLCDEFDSGLEDLGALLKKFRGPRCVSVATGAAAYDYIKRLCGRLAQAVDGLEIKVYKIINDFFGHSITVAGLLTGTDIARQLEGMELGDELLIPSSSLRDGGDLFLCGMTPDELAGRLGVRVRTSGQSGLELIEALLGSDK